jgi:hypothetical protein
MSRESSAAGAAAPARPRRPVAGRTPGGTGLGQDASRDARRLAAAILEVLAGVRTPTDAATALALSLPRYYQLESQALRGLLAACEPRPRGRSPDVERELTELRQQQVRLQREVARQQTLTRLAQRTIGLAPPAPAAAVPAGKRKQRRPTARALRVAARLQEVGDGEAAAAAPAAAPEATR